MRIYLVHLIVCVLGFCACISRIRILDALKAKKQEEKVQVRVVRFRAAKSRYLRVPAKLLPTYYLKSSLVG